MKYRPIDVTRLRDLFIYDSATGLFRWISDRSRVRAGDVAGYLTAGGRLVIEFDDQKFGAHRLAWAYETGQSEFIGVDHIDGDTGNNRFANLRLANQHQNMQNRECPSSNNKAGMLGASQGKNGRWRAAIKVHGRGRHLGTFATAEEAHAAYLAAKREVHPFWVPRGTPA